jgi:hypothetical protein
MQIPPQVTIRDIDHSDALDTHILRETGDEGPKI